MTEKSYRLIKRLQSLINHLKQSKQVTENLSQHTLCEAYVCAACGMSVTLWNKDRKITVIAISNF